MLSGGLKLAKDKFGYPLVITRPVKRESRQVESSSDVTDKITADNVDGENLSIDDLFNLNNSAVPLQVAEILTEQLSQVILPPLTLKTAGSEHWLGSNCASSVASGEVSVRSNKGSVTGCPRTNQSSLAGCSTVIGRPRTNHGTSVTSRVNPPANVNTAASTVISLGTNRTEKQSLVLKPWR